MPNGNPEFQETVPLYVEAFFAQFANVLHDFCSNHNLRLERYYHESHCWMFTFRHPKGGVGSINVCKGPEDSLTIEASWWIDDFDEFARFLLTDDTPEYKVHSENLAETLVNQLKKILSWEKGQLTRGDEDFEPYWKPYKEELAAYEERLPRPNV